MEVIIGLEIHLQLKTESKMFCGCKAQYFEHAPNTLTCPICMGFPGVLPLPNKHALELCILLGLATNCDIAHDIKFDRKHYYYPDLPKGYQISQYDEPLCSDGYVMINSLGDKPVRVDIERIHQEEDVAKTFHTHDRITSKEYTLIDYNKSGVPLVEIVTKPVIKSAADAKAFASKIRQIARYLEISDADMEKGQMRCEPNISLQQPGAWKCENGKILPVGNQSLNPKVEVKNIGSISAVEKAIEYEIARMTEEIDKGNKLIQQTRGWNAEKGITEFQRTKESADDYRYFREPDIPNIILSHQDIEAIAANLIELPDEKEERYTKDFGLSAYDISVLTASRTNADYFEALFSALKLKMHTDDNIVAKKASNWLTTVIFAYLKEHNLSLNQINVSIEDLATLISAAESKKINNIKAKELLIQSLEQNTSLKQLLEVSDVSVVTDTDALTSIVKEIIDANPKAIEDYKAGKEAAIGFLIGQVMRKSSGKASPNSTRDILIKLLKNI